MRTQQWQQNPIQVTTEPAPNYSPTPNSDHPKQGVNLTINSAKLMQLLHDGHLVASDIHCLGNCSKECVRGLLLRCVHYKICG